MPHLNKRTRKAVDKLISTKGVNASKESVQLLEDAIKVLDSAGKVDASNLFARAIVDGTLDKVGK